MADFTIFVDSKKYSWSVRPRARAQAPGVAFGEVMVRLDQPQSAMNLRRRSPGGRVPVLQHGALAIWGPLAMLAPMTTRFVSPAMLLGAKAAPW
jgi:glutathione S-transferase